MGRASGLKSGSNGYSLFRQEILAQKIAEGRHLSDEDLRQTCDDLWEAMSETEKEVWKNKAKDRKIRKREELANQVANGENFAEPAPFCSTERTKIPRLQRESKFKGIVDTNVVENLEKRRAKDRDSFDIAFNWKFDDDHEALKNEKFVLLSSSLLHTGLEENEYVPAEIACVEFTLKDGVIEKYCVPVNALTYCHMPKVADEVFKRAETTHKFTIEDLTVIGKPCDKIIERALDVSTRSSQCLSRNVRFFVLSCDWNQTLGCLEFLLKNSTVELNDQLNDVSGVDLAFIDDLAYALFKFFDVDIPKIAFDGPKLDLPYLIDLSANKSSDLCADHEAMDDVNANAVCCLTKLTSVVELIRDCVNKKKFDDFDGESSKIRYRDPLLRALYGLYQLPGRESRLRRVSLDESNYDLSESAVEYVDVDKYLKAPKTDVVRLHEDNETTQNVLETSTETLVDKNNDDDGANKSSQLNKFIKEYRNGHLRTMMFDDPFDVLPDTLAVQQFLQSGRRGFGRGLGYTSAGELLIRVSRFKNAFVLK